MMKFVPCTLLCMYLASATYVWYDVAALSYAVVRMDAFGAGMLFVTGRGVIC